MILLENRRDQALKERENNFTLDADQKTVWHFFIFLWAKERIEILIIGRKEYEGYSLLQGFPTPGRQLVPVCGLLATRMHSRR